MGYFDPVAEGNPYTYIYQIGIPSASPVKLVGANQNRVAIIYSTNNNFFMGLSTYSSPPSLIPQYYCECGNTIVIKWEDVGQLVAQPWYHWATQVQGINQSTPLNQWTCTEVIYQAVRT